MFLNIRKIEDLIKDGGLVCITVDKQKLFKCKLKTRAEDLVSNETICNGLPMMHGFLIRCVKEGLDSAPNAPLNVFLCCPKALSGKLAIGEKQLWNNCFYINVGWKAMFVKSSIETVHIAVERTVEKTS